MSTPQFITPRALSNLQTNQPAPESYWVSAFDPVAPCGLGLNWDELPHRRQGNYLAFSDGKLALAVIRNGRTLTYHVEWDDPNIDAINAVLTHLVEQRRQTLRIESINNEPAKTSPYLSGLSRLFDTTQDHKHVFLQPTFQ